MKNLRKKRTLLEEDPLNYLCEVFFRNELLLEQNLILVEYKHMKKIFFKYPLPPQANLI